MSVPENNNRPHSVDKLISETLLFGLITLSTRSENYLNHLGSPKLRENKCTFPCGPWVHWMYTECSLKHRILVNEWILTVRTTVRTTTNPNKPVPTFSGMLIVLPLFFRAIKNTDWQGISIFTSFYHGEKKSKKGGVCSRNKLQLQEEKLFLRGTPEKQLYLKLKKLSNFHFFFH